MPCTHSDLNNCFLSLSIPLKVAAGHSYSHYFVNPKKTKLLESYIPRNIRNVFAQQSRGTLAANANVFVLPWKIQQGHNSSKVGLGTLAKY